MKKTGHFKAFSLFKIIRMFLCFSSLIIALKLGALNKVKIREDRACLHFLGFAFLKNRNL